jgi:hypothetical protein
MAKSPSFIPPLRVGVRKTGIRGRVPDCLSKRVRGVTVFGEGKERKKNFWPGGHDNPLKRLISDKGIQGNQSIFLGKMWLELGLAWLGFGLAWSSSDRGDQIKGSMPPLLKERRG